MDAAKRPVGDLEQPEIVSDSASLHMFQAPVAPSPIGQDLHGSVGHPWFALYVKSRHEKSVSQQLQSRGYEGLVPLYIKRSESRVSELPLFPGYVFSRFDVTRRLPVMSVPGVFSIVKTGNVPTPIPEQEIFNLQKLVESQLPRQPCEYLEAGQRIVITTGPMRGIEGTFVGSKNRGTLIVSVEVLRRSVAVEVDGVTLAWPATRGLNG